MDAGEIGYSDGFRFMRTIGSTAMGGMTEGHYEKRAGKVLHKGGRLSSAKRDHRHPLLPARPKKNKKPTTTTKPLCSACLNQQSTEWSPAPSSA